MAFSSREWELFVQLESVYGTSPGALAGTDAFKCVAQNPFTRHVARYDRDKDQGNSASVLSTQKGKEFSSYQVAGDLIPSGNAVTPTAPDMSEFFEAHFGLKHTATAHTTLAAGSTTTVLNFTAGGVAATGAQVGDLIMVDVGGAFGYEVRQITVIATDVVTVHLALSQAPAAAQAVKLGTTYRLSASTFKSIYLWEFLFGNNFRHVAPGNSVKTMGISCDFSSQTPVATVNFAGEGLAIAAQTATSKPTSVTNGQPLLPSVAKAWIGSTAVLCLTKASLQSDNALELRMNESCSLVASGLKRTGNGGNYNITQNLELLLLTGYIEGLYDAASALTSYDVTCQLGVTPGATFAWRTPKWILDGVTGDQDGEVNLQMSGRAYALTTIDTELVCAFL